MGQRREWGTRCLSALLSVYLFVPYVLAETVPCGSGMPNQMATQRFYGPVPPRVEPTLDVGFARPCELRLKGRTRPALLSQLKTAARPQRMPSATHHQMALVAHLCSVGLAQGWYASGINQVEEFNVRPSPHCRIKRCIRFTERSFTRVALVSSVAWCRPKAPVS
jgi:hypothetical protein